ncbi:MAG: 3-oxoacyl-ACP synthase, partial [Symploca sp. SIO1C4]|nr:3-oxoacyl-ACP synthase [Symploca sp. SIO1C4]
GKSMSKLIRDHTKRFLCDCIEGAAAAAGLTLNQIDFFVFSTPFAWFISLCINVLGIDPERTINLYPNYANIGAALPATNLYYAAQLGKFRENSIVLLFSIGASSTAGATVMRWGNVALAPASSPNKPLSLVKNSEERSLALC